VNWYKIVIAIRVDSSARVVFLIPILLVFFGKNKNRFVEGAKNVYGTNELGKSFLYTLHGGL
jgi:hypothetical protein